MRILHVVISRGWSAQSANAFLTIKHQGKNGYDLHVVTLEGSSIEQHLAHLENPNIRIYPIKRHHSPVMLKVLANILKKQSFDSIHHHGPNAEYFSLLAWLLHARKISFVRSLRDRLKPMDKLARLKWKGFTRVVVPNEFVRRQLGPNITRNTRVEIVHPPVDAELFAPIPKADRTRPIIGMFARFDPVKDYPVFFEACSILARKDLKFEIVVAGKNFDDGHRKKILFYMEQCGLASRTRVLGVLPEIQHEIAKIDIGVIASNGSEELSRIALEYMACGVPVVSTTVGGLPEIVTRDVGILVPPKSPYHLARALQSLIIDERWRKQLGTNGRKTVIDHYSVPVHCKCLEQCYCNCIV